MSMKKYGVNWALVLVANLLCVWPVNAWTGDLLQFPAGEPSWRHRYYFAQSVALSSFLTFMFSLGYDRTLNDPQAIEKLRRKTGSRLARSRSRWFIVWGVLLSVVAVISVTTRVIAGRPAWSEILAYCTGLPVDLLIWAWLMDRATIKGDLAQKLKSMDDSTVAQ